MKHSFYLFVSLSLLALGSMRVAAQGCSDAGACSVGSLNLTYFNFEKLAKEVNTLTLLKEQDVVFTVVGIDSVIATPTTESTSASRQVENNNVHDTTDKSETKVYSSYLTSFYRFSTQLGIADDGTTVFTNQVEINARVNTRLFAQVKLPYSFINGRLGHTNGLSDVTVALSYFVITKPVVKMSIIGGLKLPTNRSDLSKNGLDLPMIYQTSLGSTDFLAGLKYSYKKWDVSFGYQHSFNTTNNGYLHQNLPQFSTYNQYSESNLLKRSDDVIMRVNRTFSAKKAAFGLSLLGIYHTSNDHITNALGERVSVKGSQGLTVNFNFSGTVAVSRKVDLFFILAQRVKAKDKQPDGLGRQFVGILGINYKVFK